MTNEEIKRQAIIDLYVSGELQNKIQTICYNHRIPVNADIQSDILQVAMEALLKYNTDKFVEAYLINPHRIVGLAVRIILRTGVYLDKRIPSGFKKSIAQDILHKSTLNTLNYISSTYDGENEDDNITSRINKARSTDDEDVLEYENQYEQMWMYIRSNLNRDEKVTLNKLLQHKRPPLIGEFRTKYRKLLPKLKTIIAQYQIEQEHE